MTEWLLDVFVPGVPAPQGSKNGFAIAKGRGANKVYTGQVAMAESSKKVKPWRKLVDQACRDAWIDREVLDGPLVAEYEFVFARLKSFRDNRPTPAHTVYPDTSKLVRSTEDAITTAGVWADDARVVSFSAVKRRAEPGEPVGARIRVGRWVAPSVSICGVEPPSLAPHTRDALKGAVCPSVTSLRPTNRASVPHNSGEMALPGLEVGA